MPMIKFDSVTKKFPNGTIAFEQLSFDVEPGQMLAITGPSGSGKTTVMRLLIKEYDPSEGEILWEDQPLAEIKPGQIHQHRQRIGVVFQDYKLIEDLNVWENIALPLDIKNSNQEKIETRVTDLLKLVDLTEKALMFPCQLSGGEAQRVSIARALATGPRIIFADEPTGNLDAKTSQRIIDLLKKINSLGTTLLLASHDQLVLSQLTDIPRVELSPSQTEPEETDVELVKTAKSTNKGRKKKQQKEKKLAQKVLRSPQKQTAEDEEVEQKSADLSTTAKPKKKTGGIFGAGRWFGRKKNKQKNKPSKQSKTKSGPSDAGQTEQKKPSQSDQ